MEFSNTSLRESSMLSLRQLDKQRTGIQIDVEHLSYSVQTGHTKELKKILDNVSFKMVPGTLTALMGPSGAGKSTLLDLLADRKLTGEWSGEIYFNNGPRSKFFDRDSAYILQDDLQIATLTVRETVHFSASFRMPEGSTPEEINGRVDLLLDLMCLNHISDSFVGDATHRGISGGQLKRLSIAVEMVALPFILFLDEPTSGLDSTMALDVMQTVRRLAAENRTCIATIHQPSPEVFELFDYLVLLSEGRLIYFGLVHQIQEYFCNQVLSYPFEEGSNPAEFVIEISEGLLIPADRTLPITTIEMEQIFNNSPYKFLPELSHQKERISVSEEIDKQAMVTEGYSRLHATTKWTQFQLLIYRNFLAIYRDKDETIAHFAKNVAVGLIFGIVFYGLGNVSKPLFDENGVPSYDVTNVSSLLFMTLMFVLMSNSEAIPHLISRNAIFRREVTAFAYAVSPYWLAHTISIIPLQIAGYFVFLVCCFFLTGYPITGSYFFYFYFVIVFSGLTTYYFTMLLAAAIQKEHIALEVFSILFLFVNSLIGYTITIDDMPSFWVWGPYLDFARWGFEGLMVNQWEDYDDDTLDQTVLELYGFDGYNKMDTFWILLIISFGFIFLIYLSLRPPVKQLVKVPYIPSTTSPLINETTANLKENLLTGADEEAQASFSKQIPRFQDGVSRSNNHTSSNSIVDATKVPKKSGYHLTFHNLSYSVDAVATTSKGALNEPLKILENVSGRVEPNEMCALMGSSGAGKSTLLDILALRKTVGTIDGHIYINGHISTPELMRSTAYVMQDSAHLSFLTVRETLEFAANFRMLQSEPEVVKEQRVNDLLATLRLDHIANSVVGSEESRGISGGQRRRLSIGVEMIHLPKMLFLDEPTTGLDSASANEVISVVRVLANQNRTVICTIHQPSVKCFAMFDKVLLLGKGQMIYFGPVETMKSYFLNCKYEFQWKEGRNVADFMLDIASGVYPSGVDDHAVVAIPQLIDMYAQSKECFELQQLLPEYVKRDAELYPLPPPPVVVDQTYFDIAKQVWIDYVPGAKEEFNTSQWFQFKTLCRRLYIERIRNVDILIGPIAKGLVAGFLFSSLYYGLDTGYDTEAYLNRLNVLFFTLMTLLIPHLQDITDLQKDRNLFYRERSAGAYSPFAYWISRFLATIPSSVIAVFLYAFLVYYSCGFRDWQTGGGGYFLYFVLVCFITDTLGHLLCQFISNISSSMQVAASIFPIFVFCLVGFEGFIIYLPNYPAWISWVAFFSYLRYAFEGLVLNEFSGNDDLPLASTYIHNLGFQSLNSGKCVLILAVFLLILSIASYLTLYYIRFERR